MDYDLETLPHWQLFYFCGAVIGFSLSAVCWLAALETECHALWALELSLSIAVFPFALLASAKTYQVTVMGRELREAARKDLRR